MIDFDYEKFNTVTCAKNRSRRMTNEYAIIAI